MKISAEQQEAIIATIRNGHAHGYGNLISHLQTACAAELMDRCDMDEKTARQASGGYGYPFQMQRDLIERGEWDETGERYRKESKV